MEQRLHANAGPEASDFLLSISPELATPLQRPHPLSELATLTLLAAGLVLLWSFRYLPMQDLPNHIAISDYTVRLLRGEAEAGRYFRLQLLGPTYRLYYLLAAPLTAAFGAITGARVLISLMWIGYVAACRALVIATGVRPWVVLALAPWFFSMQFFMGLLPSLLATVFVLWAVWGLLRFEGSGGRTWAGLAALFGTLAMVSHVVMAVLWLAALLAWAVLSPRRRARAAALMAGVSLLPALLWLGAGAAGRGLDAGGLWGPMRHLRLSQYARWVLAPSRLGSTPVDLGRAALLAGAFVVVGVLVWRLARGRGSLPLAGPAATVALVGGAWWLAFFLTPNYVVQSGAWAINVRYVELAALATTMVGGYGLRFASARVERAALGLVVLAVLIQAAGLYRTFARVDREYRAIEEICSAVPFGATLTTSALTRGAFGTDLALAYHASGYCSVGRAAYNGAVFRNSQMPVRTAPGALEPAPSALVGRYDFMLYDTVAKYAPPPADGELVVASGRWRLYRRSPT